MAACCFMLFCGCGAKEPALLIQEEDAGPEDMEQPGMDPEPGNSQEADSLQEELIYVQVSGAVAKPGVYQVPAGSRVFVAVELAGGLTPEADEGSLNQAQALSDGQQVYVYALGEGGGPEEAQASDGRVNLNTATAEELMSLPGIGQAKADSIISYRESSGGFQAIEDLMKIEGIKEGVFSKIKDRVKI